VPVCGTGRGDASRCNNSTAKRAICAVHVYAPLRPGQAGGLILGYIYLVEQEIDGSRIFVCVLTASSSLRCDCSNAMCGGEQLDVT
jgi:hypothetical protein